MFLSSKYVDKIENCAILPTQSCRYQLLKANSLSVVGRTPRRVEASDPCIYVQQREVVRRCLEKQVFDQSSQVAVIAPGDHLRILGSEDATTCHIVVLRWMVS